MPEEKETGREREEQLIRHLRRQAGGIVGGGLPDQPTQDSPNESEIFHLD